MAKKFEEMNSFTIAKELTDKITPSLAMLVYPDNPVASDELSKSKGPDAFRILKGETYFSDQKELAKLISWLEEIPSGKTLAKYLQQFCTTQVLQPPAPVVAPVVAHVVAHVPVPVVAHVPAIQGSSDAGLLHQFQILFKSKAIASAVSSLCDFYHITGRDKDALNYSRTGDEVIEYFIRIGKLDVIQSLFEFRDELQIASATGTSNVIFLAKLITTFLVSIK